MPSRVDLPMESAVDNLHGTIIRRPRFVPDQDEQEMEKELEEFQQEFTRLTQENSSKIAATVVRKNERISLKSAQQRVPSRQNAPQAHSVTRPETQNTSQGASQGASQDDDGDMPPPLEDAAAEIPENAPQKPDTMQKDVVSLAGATSTQSKEPKKKKKVSLFAASRLKQTQQSSSKETPANNQPKSMISSVVERTVDQTSFSKPKTQIFSSGFPTVSHRSSPLSPLDSFALDHSQPSHEDATVRDPLKQQIHEENESRLKLMSEQELEDARKQVMTSLNPELVGKLLKRIQKSEHKEETTKMTQNQTQNHAEEEEDPLPISPSELPKLEWTIESSNATQPSSTSLLRFDFEGSLITTSEIPTHYGLHHHGSDPDKPGYTIHELCHLSRSTVAGQRVIAVRTLGRILDRFNASDENGCNNDQKQRIWKSITKLGVYIYVRSCLESQNSTVLSSAVEALWLGLGGSQLRALAEQWLNFTAKREKLLLMTPENQQRFAACCALTGNELPSMTEDEEGEHAHDIITALLQTGIMKSLGRILRTTKSFTERDMILDILLRIALHSPHAIPSSTLDMLHSLSITQDEIITQPDSNLPVSFVIILLCGISDKTICRQWAKSQLDDWMRYLSLECTSKAWKLMQQCCLIAFRLNVLATTVKSEQEWTRIFVDYYEVFNGLSTKTLKPSFWSLLSVVYTRRMELMEHGWCTSQIQKCFSKFVGDALEILKRSNDEDEVETVIKFLLLVAKDSKNVYALLNPLLDKIDISKLIIRLVEMIDTVNRKWKSETRFVRPQLVDLEPDLVGAMVQATHICDLIKALVMHRYSTNLDLTSRAEWINRLRPLSISITSLSRFFSIGLFELQSLISETTLSSMSMSGDADDLKPIIQLCLTALINAVPSCEETIQQLLGMVFNSQWVVSILESIGAWNKTNEEDRAGVVTRIESVLKDVVWAHVVPISDDSKQQDDEKKVNANKKYDSWIVEVLPTTISSDKHRQVLGLPLPHLWSFTIIDEYSHLESLTADEVSLIEASLWFNIALEMGCPSDEDTKALKLVKCMQIFSMNFSEASSKEPKEVYREFTIPSALASCLTVFSTRALPNFYSTYQSLINIYSSSFGEEVISKYVMLGLMMNLPHDYRVLFWDELELVPPLVNIEDKMIKLLTEPEERNVEVLMRLARAVNDSKLRNVVEWRQSECATESGASQKDIHMEKIPSLWVVVCHHLRKLVERNDEVGVEMDEKEKRIAETVEHNAWVKMYDIQTMSFRRME